MKEEDKFEQIVSSALGKGAEFDLPPGFSDRVLNKIQQKILQREMRRDRLWLIVGIVSMLSMLIYAFTKVKFTPGVGVFTFLSGYWGLITFGALFVIALHIIDRRLLKKQESG